MEDFGWLTRLLKMSTFPDDDVAISRLIAMLRPAPPGWVEAAQQLPTALRAMESDTWMLGLKDKRGSADSTGLSQETDGGARNAR